MGTLWAQSGQVAFDNNGDRAPGALAYFTNAGTSTPKVVYQDAAETTPHTDPLAADGNGRWPAVFVPFGSFKTRITTSAGAAIGAAIDNIPNAAPPDPGVGVDANSLLTTGDVWWSLKNGTRAGAVRLNGRTIGNAASGATERANADTANLFAFIWDNCANGQAAVSTGRGANAAADFAANKTIALPDFRGAGLVGFDDMGNSAASRFTSVPVVSGSDILPGSILGETANLHTLTTVEMAAHTHSFSATSSSDGSHTHTATTTTQGAHEHTATTSSNGAHTHTLNGYGNANDIVEGAGVGVFLGGTGSVGTTSDGAHTHTLTTSNTGDHQHSLTTDAGGSHTHTISGTTGSTGSGTAHNVLGRSGVGTWYIRL